jgi:hypothetical protein
VFSDGRSCSARICSSRRSSEENIAADGLVLPSDQLFALDDIGEAVGDRYADMSPLNR